METERNDFIKSYYEVKTQWIKKTIMPKKKNSQISSQDSYENIGTEKVEKETSWFIG